MSTLLRALAVLVVAGLPLVLATPQEAAAQACACLDKNADLQCGGAPDVLVADADWLNGPTSGQGGNFPGETFILPEGCNKVQAAAVSGGIRVNAQRIIVRGQLTSTPATGLGVLLTATQDIIVEPGASATRPKIVSGGNNTLANNVANAGIARASVGLKAGTSCSVLSADLTGNPYRPGTGQIGIQCAGDVNLHNNVMNAGGIDIQSLNGNILAHGAPAEPVGAECDDPVTNLTSNGNDNGAVDAGDFPCRIRFDDTGDITAFCTADPHILPNVIRAHDNPLSMIAKQDIRLDNPVYPGNILVGFFKMVFIAEDGSIDYTNADLLNHIPQPPMPAGAGIYSFSNPFSVNRAPVLQETAVGPSTGTMTISGACFVSAQTVFVGTATGTPTGVPKAGSSTISSVACRTLAQHVPIISGP